MSTQTDTGQRNEVPPPKVLAPGQDTGPSQPTLEFEQLSLDRFKAKLDFWKFVLGSVFAAVAIAAIGPAFQLATAFLETQNKEADRLKAVQEFRENNIKSYLTTAVNQDIELRLRFADYFAAVSLDPDRKQWKDYREYLKTQRDDVRNEIDQLEQERGQEASMPRKDTEKIDRMVRHLGWLYKELGYVEPNRNVPITQRALALSTNDKSLTVIAKSQRLSPGSISTSSIPSPIRDPATIAKMTVGECVVPDNEEFLRTLKEGIMLPGQGKVVMIKEFWDKANADIKELKNALPGLYSKLYIANQPVCVSKQYNGELYTGEATQLKLYLEQADVSGDIGSWDQKKVDDYRRLVDFMNSKGWYWSYFTGYDYSYEGTFLPSNVLVSELMRRR